MLLSCRVQHRDHTLSYSPPLSSNPKSIFNFFMLTSPFNLLRSLSLSVSLNHRPICFFAFPLPSLSKTPTQRGLSSFPRATAISSSAYVEQSVSKSEEEDGGEPPYNNLQVFDFDKCCASTDLKHLSAPDLEVKELDELPDQWRRSRLAWLCKELPAHKAGTLIRILNAQKKWITQEDATYIAVHCMRIRENETGFRVYKWMMQQHWYRFDFALATKLADFMGKERKFAKCREIFDDIINQACIPSESTFHILIVAYLSAPVQGCLEEACNIYSRMIQLGGYQPRLSLHNSLFKALVSKQGISSKHFLKQAEFIYHNLDTTGLEIHKDIYSGLVWLHSYQDIIDKERIASLRKEMQQLRIEEGKEMLLSILRICSKVGDVKEAERTWKKLILYDSNLPSTAFVYKMEAYSKVGDPMKCLDIFREMQESMGGASIAAHHKIIEILCRYEEIELVESLMTDFMKSDLKPLTPSYIHLMNMYFNLNLYNTVELAFYQCLEKCRPNHTIYSIYLDSLVKVGNLEQAESIFNQMKCDDTVGINSRSCNIILSGYLSTGDYRKAEITYNLMCQKKFDIETPLMEKLEFVLSLSRKNIRRPVTMKLSKEQREILIGLLLGGLQIESDEQRKNHIIRFNFNENCGTHCILKRYIHDQFSAWLHPCFKQIDGDEDIPNSFSSITHSYFGFYADQFWPTGCPKIPKLIHRWLSPPVLAYWYMYGGHRSSTGDILLKLKGNREGVDKIVNALKAKSIDCKVKRKGRGFWIGILGSNSPWFWKLVEPYILQDLKCLLEPGSHTLENSYAETQNMNFNSDSDELDSDYTHDDGL